MNYSIVGSDGKYDDGLALHEPPGFDLQDVKIKSPVFIIHPIIAIALQKLQVLQYLP